VNAEPGGSKIFEYAVLAAGLRSGRFATCAPSMGIDLGQMGDGVQQGSSLRSSQTPDMTPAASLELLHILWTRLRPVSSAAWPPPGMPMRAALQNNARMLR
jgi:hypothetical protein